MFCKLYQIYIIKQRRNIKDIIYFGNKNTLYQKDDMLYIGRILKTLPHEVQLGKYILIPTDDIYYGTQININQTVINIWAPVYTGRKLLLGERAFFLSKDQLDNCAPRCCNSEYILYEQNDFLENAIENLDLPSLDQWTGSLFTGALDDGKYIYYFRQGCLLNRARMSVKTISRSINVLTSAQNITIGLEVPLLQIRISNDSQLQLALPLVNLQIVNLDISAFPENTSPVFIYTYYVNSTKATVLYTVNKILEDPIIIVNVDSTLTTQFGDVVRSGKWISDFGVSTANLPTFWSINGYNVQASGNYRITYTLTNARSNLNIQEDINLWIRINDNRLGVKTFTRGGQPDPLEPNITYILDILMEPNDFVQFGYDKEGAGHTEYDELITNITKLP